MNKLKWFTHDNDAHEDEWHQDMMDIFGVEGYGRWWILLELFDRHGTGDSWVTKLDFLRKNLRTSRTKLRVFLGFCQTNARVLSDFSGGKVKLQIPKFRKRQANLKSKIRSKPSKTTQEGEGEGEGEVYTTSGKNGTAKISGQKAARERSEFQVFMDRFLSECMDVKPGVTDKKIVSAHYRRFGRAGRDVLAMAGGDAKKAMSGVIGVGTWLQSKGLSWTLDTISKHITDYFNNPRSFENGTH